MVNNSDRQKKFFFFLRDERNVRFFSFQSLQRFLQFQRSRTRILDSQIIFHLLIAMPYMQKHDSTIIKMTSSRISDLLKLARLDGQVRCLINDLRATLWETMFALWFAMVFLPRAFLSVGHIADSVRNTMFILSIAPCCSLP